MHGVVSFSELKAKIDLAREDYNRACAAQREALLSYIDDSDPNAAQEVYEANEALQLALERYTDALDKLTDHVLKRD